MLRLISVSALAGLVAVAPASSQTVLPPNQQLMAASRDAVARTWRASATLRSAGDRRTAAIID